MLVMRLFPRALLPLALTFALSACGDSPVDPELALLGRAELSVDGQRVATWTHTGGWEGGVPQLSLAGDAEGVRVDVRMFTRALEERPLGSLYTVRYVLDPGAVEGVLDTRPTLPLWGGDHVRLYPQGQGSTRIRFLLWRGGAPEGVTTALEVRVAP
jgi:hypothetical protein